MMAKLVLAFAMRTTELGGFMIERFVGGIYALPSATLL